MKISTKIARKHTHGHHALTHTKIHIYEYLKRAEKIAKKKNK